MGLLPKEHLSPSQITSYLRCGLGYWWSYCEGIKSPPSVALLEGDAYHGAVQHNNRHHQKHQANLRIRDVIAAFEAAWVKRRKEIEDWEGEKERDVVRRGRVVLARYMTDHAPRLMGVQAVEEKVEGLIAGFPVVGYVDLTAAFRPDRRPRIWDYKCSNRAIGHDLAHHVQLGVYACLKGREEVGVIRMERAERGKIEFTIGTVGPDRQRFVALTVAAVATGIKAGAFPPTDPSNWWCSAKWCGYWPMCRGARKTQANRSLQPNPPASERKAVRRA